MTGKLYVWHRRLALLVMTPLLLFGLSGLLHPVMRLTAPEMENRFYVPPQWPQGLPAIDQLSSAIPLQKTAGLRPVYVSGNWYLQHWSNRKIGSQFYDLEGDKVNELEQAYATQLARHFSGDQSSPVRQVRLITEFGRSYPAINRLLPVWEVQFERDDHLSVFVDIRQERLGGLVDDQRRIFMNLFQILHVWSFIDQESSLRTALFIGLMTAALALGLSGIYLFSVLPLKRRKNNDLKKVHAWSGMLVSLALVMFVFSGLVRTIEKQMPEIRGVHLNQQMDLSGLDIGFNEIRNLYPKVTNAYPHLLNGEVVWQVIQPRQKDIWMGANSQEVIADGANLFAGQLLSGLGLEKRQSNEARLITSFRDDEHYGFIDKRLPVVALDYSGKSYYVDIRDAVLSVRVNESDKLYSWIFRYLHKWRFADGLGLNGRDGLISIFVLTISVTILLGFISWLNGRRKRKKTVLKSEKRIEPTLSI